MEFIIDFLFEESKSEKVFSYIFISFSLFKDDFLLFCCLSYFDAFFVEVVKQQEGQNVGGYNELAWNELDDVYNAKNYLPDCIDSLLFQSFSNAEYIFVDDSSDDDSEKIINIYTKLAPKVKLLRQNHGGAGKARNLGLDYTKGRYVTFLV